MTRGEYNDLADGVEEIEDRIFKLINGIKTKGSDEDLTKQMLYDTTIKLNKARLVAKSAIR